MNAITNSVEYWTGMSDKDAVKAIRAVCGYFLAGVEGDEPDPEDVAQEVVVEVLSVDFGRGYEPRVGSRWGYVVGTARICCLKALARVRRDAMRTTSHSRSNVDDPFIRAMATEFRDGVRQVSRWLTDKELAALELVIERAEGTRPSTRRVRHEHVRATRCRKHLRRLLKDYGPDGPCQRRPRGRK